MRFIAMFILLQMGLVAASEFSLTDDEQSAFQLTNAERRKAGVSELTLNEQLCEIARAHSREMAATGKLEHQLSAGTPGERLRKAGIQYLGLAENIGCNNAAAPSRVVKDWMNSSGHRENLLDRNYTTLGIGVANDAEGRTWFTQVFCRMGVLPPPAPTEIVVPACCASGETPPAGCVLQRKICMLSVEPALKEIKIKFELRNESDKQVSAWLP